MKKIIRKILVKWYFRKIKPMGFGALCRHGNLLEIDRIIYEEQCEESCDYYLVGISGVKIGYPEKDEHFRKRALYTMRGIK